MTPYFQATLVGTIHPETKYKKTLMKFGVFDSGIGGVTVLQALRKQFPSESFAYFGDTLNVPYGTKSATQIRALSRSAAERIRAHSVDALVVACNTASSLALPEIESVLGTIPVYGMVEAGVRAVVRAAKNTTGPIVVFGTRATVRSGVYGKLFREEFANATGTEKPRAVFEQACPLLVPIIEEGWVRHSVLEATLREYIAPYRDQSPGVALLACTHYPWIRETFEHLLPGWNVVDSADAVASRLQDESLKLGLQARILDFSKTDASKTDASKTSSVSDTEKLAPVEWFFSDPEVAPFIFKGSENAPVIRTF